MDGIIEKVILIGVNKDDGEDTEASCLELKELAKTAGAETVATVIQSRGVVHPNTYIGLGKIEEVKELLEKTGANGVICDDELSPSQMNELEKMLDVKVMDRTILILDIFASRACTAEGKIQVELAQLKYSLTRLTGFGTSMSRLGGGIGTRGPGESKLESDRRVVRNRVAQLNRELKEVVKHRDVTRKGRDRNKIPVVAIVGYTNAGKSTLLNKLTNADILAEDKLFATLDPTTRSLKLPEGQNILLTDTVGFINKLPHHLVDAFKSTLEEAKYADVLVHVVDASNEAYNSHIEVVYETLSSLKIEGKPVITLFNKCDRVNDRYGLKDLKASKSVCISALTGEGLCEFLDALTEILRDGKIYVNQLIPFSEASKLNLIRTRGELLKEEYTGEGIEIEAYIPKDLQGKLL